MLYYRKYIKDSSADWTIFIHGAGGSSSLWFKQIREFRKKFNVLMVDLRGHGKSKNFFKDFYDNRFTMQDVSNDIIEVLDHENIDKAHFVGLSLGTIIIRNLAEIVPNRIQSMTMGGAVMNFNKKSKFLVGVGTMFKRIFPYMWLYKLLAFAVMPRERNRESRNLFINEAKKVGQKEFLRWYKIIHEMPPLLRLMRNTDTGIPTLYIMGEYDYLFLEPVKQIVQNQKKCFLEVIEKCGHVCNVEEPEQFNNASINFIQKYAINRAV